MIYLLLIVLLGYLGYYYYKHFIKKPDETAQEPKPHAEPKPKPEATREQKATVQSEDKTATLPKQKSSTQVQPSMDATSFPYPAKKPGGCRFTGAADYTNYQDYGEEEVEIDDKDFKLWEMVNEDPDLATLSWVGMDKQNRCLLQRKHYPVPRQPNGLDWKKRYFLIKRNVMASFLALAVIEGHTTFHKYKQMMERLDQLVPPTGDPAIDGYQPLLMTQETYDRLEREKREREKKELEKRKQKCADFWDKVVWEDNDCSLFFEKDQPVMICHGKRFSFGCDSHEPMTIIYGDGVKYLHNGFDVGDECRYFLKNPQGKTSSITGQQYDAMHFCHLLFAATTFGGDSVGIVEVEKRLDEMMAHEKRKDMLKNNPENSQLPTPNSQLLKFPYPAKNPGGCRFPASGENANFQEYGEEPIKMTERDFQSWWFFYEDPEKPCMSHIGMDNQNRCILERRYVHGDLNHWTVKKRYFLITRNTMASCLALALIENAMERSDYKELIAKLDRLVPPTGDPAKDGCPPLLPPQELLDRKSESEIEAEEKEKEWQTLNGKVVWKDEKRKLFFQGTTPILRYNGERYTFSCQPYEPMAIILQDEKPIAYIHNAFYPDECKGFIENSRYLVDTITGKHHNAERFCRLLTTAIDSFFDCQIDEVEHQMQKELVQEKGIGYIQFETRDFKCEKVLYEGIYLLLGHFENALSKENHVGKIYSIAFGYPNRNSDYFEYYLLSEQEHHEFKKWPENRQWKDKEEAFDWEHKNLEGKKQELCNEFDQNPGIYKPVFTLNEIPRFKKPTAQQSNDKPIHIHYSRKSVCAADDYVNRDLEIKMSANATVDKLVEYIQHYYDGESYSAIPYTGGGNWWTLESDKGIIAQVNDDGKGVKYKMDPSTPLKNLGITRINGTI